MSSQQIGPCPYTRCYHGQESLKLAMVWLLPGSKSAGDKASYLTSVQSPVLRHVSILCSCIAELNSLLWRGHECYLEYFLSLLNVPWDISYSDLFLG